jgi:arginine-tRNA-protein transferase
MFAQITYPLELGPEELDNYLANGWFRMRQAIFTTNFLQFHDIFYSAIWLRVAMAEYQEDKKFKTSQKLNEAFRVEIKKSETSKFSVAHEQLFQEYRQSISFEVSNSLGELLLGNDSPSIFNTHEVNIFDGDNLIAAGFFDLGKTAAAGITCIYHPAYKKHSLGKYLIYLKINFCLKQKLQYFYPGYAVPGYTPFDYKLTIGKSSLQYLQMASQQWLPINQVSDLQNPLHKMVEKLTEAQKLLNEIILPTTFQYYRFFEANLNLHYLGNQLLDFPVFLICYPTVHNTDLICLVFDVIDNSYYLLQASSVIHLGPHQENCPVYEESLLKADSCLFVSSTLSAMVNFLSKY